VCRRTKDDITSSPTITAKRSSFWDIFLFSPGDDTVTSLSGFTGQYDFIDEHKNFRLQIEDLGSKNMRKQDTEKSRKSKTTVKKLAK
jgi:hypothetical protein